MTDDATLIDASIFPRLVVRRGGQVVQEVTLETELSIGRAEDNDLKFMDPKVSRHHARITREGSACILTDLESANGTLVNGVPLTGPHALRHGERIVIGDQELTYQEPGRSSEETIISPVAAPVAQAAAARQPARPLSPPPRSRGGSRGLTLGLVVAAAVLLVAVVIVALYFLVPDLFGRVGPDGEATPTQPVAVVTTAIPPPTETPVDVTPPTAELPTPKATATTPVPEASPMPGEDLDDLLAQADGLARRSRFEDAQAIYGNVAQQAPDDARPEIGWAWALIWDDEADEAIAHAERATELDPSSAEAAAALARAYLDTGDETRALTEALEAVQLDANSAAAHAVLAEAYMVNGQNQQAVDEADLALVLDLNYADAHRIRGWLYHVVDNDMGRAAGELQSAAGLQPELWLRRHELGVLLLKAEDYTTAIMAFQDALSIRPKAVTYTAIGQAYYELGQYSQASASLRQALAAGADDLDTYALLGAAYAHEGRCDDAEIYYNRALDLDATDPLALEAQDLCEGAAPSPTPSATTAAPSVPTPTSTPAPTLPPPPPPALTGRIAFPVWNAQTYKYDTYLAQARDGSGRQLVVEEMHQPALSPDGEWLAVNGERHEHMNLFIVRPDGSDLHEITEHIEDGLPCWSPDGKALVFSSTRHGDKQSRVYIIDEVPFAGGKVGGRTLNFGPDDVRGAYPAWTSDGRIVFQGCDLTVEPAECGLYIMPDAPGPHPMTWLTDYAEDTAPAVYGNRIAFMSNRDGNWEIYVMNIDGSGVRRLTSNAANDGLPTWSPDGRTIAFVSDQGGAWAVWAMSPDGSSRRKLFPIGGGGLASEWQHERISWGP